MLSIESRSNEVIDFDRTACTGQAINLLRLRDCHLSFAGYVGAVYIYECKDCEISVGYVKGACNIYECERLHLKTVW